MSSVFSDLDQSIAPLAPEFFYSNLRIQETLTTIRYGIEARRGLTIVTGAAGIGKSTLLCRAATDLAPNTICIFGSDPRVSFADILRLILRHLDGDPANGDEASMLRTCRLQLRERLDQCRIVALFLDNAHQFQDATLRSIIQNFLVGSAEDPEGTLLQLILAGRPEIRTKISRAAATSVRCRKPVVCELQPLNSGEVAAFIEKSLKGNRRPPGIFDERAIKRIALYANGNPGMVNSICEKAWQLAGASTDASIPADLVEAAASELDLRRFDDAPKSEPVGLSSNTVKFADARAPDTFDDDYDIPYKIAAHDEASRAPIFPPHAAGSDEVTWRAPKRRPAAWVRGLGLLVLLVCGVAIIGTDTLRDVAREGIATLDRAVMPYLKLAGQARISETPTISETPAPTAALAPLPGPDRPVAINEDRPAARAPDNGRSAAAPPSDKLLAPRQARPEPRATPPAHELSQPSRAANAGGRSGDLQTQISKAIENRAIMGVEVSVVQGTAILDGHVATERQRRAAERAARSVAGVERVRNRIAITFG
jgi:type II secretory pathway predicted ATPase ExeA